jgi:hypothetical protein
MFGRTRGVRGAWASICPQRKYSAELVARRPGEINLSRSGQSVVSLMKRIRQTDTGLPWAAVLLRQRRSVWLDPRRHTPCAV